ncbi:MAG TPA: DUF2752 domain-containing protein [Desulfuromonadaceae bacterium]|nr:DUF2752 domain-containing protein [Desulfuromonadaceae bacterium]
MTPATPPRIKTTDSLGVFVAVIVAITIVGGAAVIFFFNPSTSRFYPICRFHQWTGLNCPGCGATRAFYALLHGYFRAAFRDNAFFIVVMAGMALRSGWFLWRKWSHQPTGLFFPPKWLLPLLVAGLVFAVLRNLPAFSYLSP